MKFNWTRRKKLFAGLGGVVVVIAVVLLVFTFVGMPGGEKLFGTAVSGTTIYRAYPTTRAVSSWEYGMSELVRLPCARPLNGFAKADGSQLNISGNQALFSILGTKYGGDGRSTFALPNLPPTSPVTGLTLTTYINVNGEFPSPGNQAIQSGGIYYVPSAISDTQSLSSRFVGEIILATNVNEAAFANTMVPCDRREMSVSKNAILYSIIGGAFGGTVTDDVRITFRLPNLSNVSSPIAGAKWYIMINGRYPN